MSGDTIKAPGSGNFVPLLLCALLGDCTELYFVSLFGWRVMLKPYFWPGFILTVFWLRCLQTRRFAPWHLFFWRFACAWSGIWAIWGVLCHVVFPLIVFYPLVEGWLKETGVDPYLALALHTMIWACSWDILRSFTPED